jgi:hypothetical protein
MLWPAGAPLVNKTAIERLRLRTTSRLGGHIRLGTPSAAMLSRGSGKVAEMSALGQRIRDQE